MKRSINGGGAAAIALAVVLALSTATPAAAQQAIGSIIELAPDAYGTPPGGQATILDLGGGVVSDQLLQTLAQASTRVRFLDDTDLRIGERSMIVLDRLIYDPDQGTGELVIGIAVGAMRFVSGDLPSQQVVIETPVAVIGIRGTDFVVVVAESGRTSVSVLEGVVIVAPFGGQPVEAGAGQSVTVEPGIAVASVQAGLAIPPDPGLGQIPEIRPPAPDDEEAEGSHSDGSSDFARDVVPSLPAPLIRPPISQPSQPHIDIKRTW